MKKNSLYYTIITFAISVSSFSQNISGIATYDIKLAEDVLDYPSVLTFNNNKSIFQFKKHKDKRWVRDEGDKQFQVIYTDSIGELIIRNEKEKHLIIRSFCQKTPYIFNDEVKLSWKIMGETRLIEGLLCKKATTYFRGRTYQAWYCPEIKVKTGPWKFHGLPGLILEVADDTKDVKISLRSLKVENDIRIIIPKTKDVQTTQSVFIKCLNVEWNKKIKKNQADILKLQAQFPDVEINDGGLSKKTRLDIATERKYD